MVDPRLEEAAKLSASWLRVLKNVSIPVIKPGIFLSGLLVIYPSRSVNLECHLPFVLMSSLLSHLPSFQLSITLMLQRLQQFLWD